MPYSEFTLSKAKKDFQITIAENVRFLPTVEPVAPSSRLLDDLEEVPWAIAVGSEKARSESIIIDLTDYPLPPVEQILGFLLWMLRS